MNFIVRKFFKKYVKPEDEGTHLIHLASASAYQAFLDKKFRELVKFDKQSEDEQNRIFNELTAAALVCLLDFIESRLPFIAEKRQEFWRGVKEKIPESLKDGMEKMGMEKKYIALWKKLLNMRVKEYKERREITEKALQEELKNNKLKDKARADFVRLEGLSLSSLLHIAGSGAKADDPLRKHLKSWLFGLNYRLEKMVGW